jgi:hypothetical protein
MSITTQFPHISPSLIEAIERAYDAVWSHRSSDRDQSDELKILLSQTLVALAANDMTDPKERRRKALETMALRS